MRTGDDLDMKGGPRVTAVKLDTMLPALFD